ncbi:hypothetical protein pdam_00003315 [Pocillopora damicornis]|uniref:Actinoporin n=1 Tax=Pocillopora damicornis TaxID=46731 RepID=A0A3M6TI60_POCDA|nr:hypothetical protein pdam_00003315 [Pocillopora damicornis]
MNTEAGTIIAAAGLTMEFLKNVLESMASVSGKIAISIGNETPYNWEAVNAYFHSGAANEVLPEFVSKGGVALYTAQKTEGPVPTGVEGVFTYYMAGADKTVAVMFSVPFSYNPSDNWWDVRIYRERKKADSEMYNSMYSHTSPFKGDDGWHTKVADGFQIKGTMTRGGKCAMKLRITK